MNVRFYRAVVAVLRPVYAVIHPSKVTGLENIPEEGGCVVCANHLHWRDPVILAVKLHKRRYTFLGKAEAFKNPLVNLILGEKGIGGIPIRRGESDLNAIRLALKAIADGEALAIFPQGTRSRDNTPTPMLTGTSMIALRAKVPVIPVYIDGPYRFFRRTDVRVGKPIDLTTFGRKVDAETLAAATAKIEEAVWGLREG